MSNLQHQQQQLFARTMTTFQKLSLYSTQIQDQEDSQSYKTQHLQKDSLPTLPQLPNSSRAMDFQQSSGFLALQIQFNQMYQRFHDIHKVFVNHSQNQSDSHELKKGFTVIPIDYSVLVTDYSNKIKIIGDIEQLIENAGEQGEEGQIGQAIDYKFYQYYLERHYAGKCSVQSNDFSLEGRFQQDNQNEESLSNTSEEIGYDLHHQPNKVYISKLQRYDSFIHQHHDIMFVEQSAQTESISLELFIESTKLIEVQIPVVIYKLKEKIVRMQESDIIQNQRTLDYDESAKKGELDQSLSDHSPSLTQLVAKDTEVQLCYSDFPEETTFKLPLDSYAQIQSLISHDSRSNASGVSRPGTDREMMIGLCQGWINEKGSRSILEKMQQNQKVLNQQIQQLTEKLQSLEKKIEQQKKSRLELQKRNTTLANRLQQQIKQNEYYSKRFDEEGIQIYQQRLQSLTQINRLCDRKITTLDLQLKNQRGIIESSALKIEQRQKSIQELQRLGMQKNEEIDYLTKLLEQKEIELREIILYEENIVEKAKVDEIELKKQIERLQKSNQELSESVKEYQSQIMKEGLCLQYEQANQIQSIIQSNEYLYELKLKEANEQFQLIIYNIQNDLSTKQKETQRLQSINSMNKETILHLHQKLKKQKMNMQHYCSDFWALINEYNAQLQQKDEEIIAIKLQVKTLMDRIFRLQEELSEEKKKGNEMNEQRKNMMTKYDNCRQDNQSLSMKCKELTHLMEQLSTLNQDNESNLIEQLSTQLERKIKECSSLKAKLDQQKANMCKVIQERHNIEITDMMKQNTKLKTMYKKIKEYCKLLEYEIKCIWKVEDCQNHKSLIDTISKDRQYFADLAFCSQKPPGNPVNFVTEQYTQVF